MGDLWILMIVIGEMQWLVQRRLFVSAMEIRIELDNSYTAHHRDEVNSSSHMSEQGKINSINDKTYL